jgi:hypothetical protein
MKEDYSTLLRSPHWQKKRLQIMERDNWKCRFCGNTEETLNSHHVLYLPNRKPWEYDDEHLLTVCDTCHKDEENLKSNDQFLINMFSMTGLNRRKLYALATSLRRHFQGSGNREEKFQDLTDFLHNT